MVEDRAPAAVAVRGPQARAVWATVWGGQLAVLLPIVTAFLFLLAWQTTSIYGDISPTILPPPTMVLEQLTGNFPLIMKHTIPTTYETLLAFGISIPLGIALAGLMVYSTLAYQALYPNIVFFQLIPKIALAPLFIVWLGIGETPKIVLIALATVFPMYLNTYNGVRSVDRKVLEGMRSFGVTGWRLVRDVVFPLALPSILTGLRFALGVSVLALIAAEQINSSAGLGYLMIQAQTYQQADVLVVCIVIYAALGLLADVIVRVVERVLMPWRASVSR